MSSVGIVRKLSWLLVYAAIGGGSLCFLVPQYRHLCALQRQRDDLRQENERIQEMIVDLRRKQERFKSDAAFVERTARERGRVKDDEVVFRFKSRDAGAGGEAER